MSSTNLDTGLSVAPTLSNGKNILITYDNTVNNYNISLYRKIVVY